MKTLLVVAALAVGCLPESTKSVTLTPATPEIADALRAADARWEAAGVDPDRIIVGDGGASVTLAPERGPTSLTMQVYRAEAFVGVRRIELNKLDVGIVTHELGHAMGADDAEGALDVGECERTLPTRPVMCEHVGRTITADDLAQVCADGGCGAFNPEVE